MAPKAKRGSSQKRRRRCKASTATTQFINWQPDVLKEILIRLPAKQIFQLKTLSKELHSTLSDPSFVKAYANRNTNPLSGLVLDGLNSPDFKDFFFVSLSGPHRRPPPGPKFLTIPQVKIVDMCNGLLCYSTKNQQDCYSDLINHCYLSNPISGTTRRVPVPSSFEVVSLNLAFDPRVSVFYNLVLVRRVSYDYYAKQKLIKIDIYSSKTQSWRPSSLGKFNVHDKVRFSNSVYYDGAVYWCNLFENSLCYYDLESDSFHNLAMPEGTSPGYPVYEGYVQGSGEPFPVYIDYLGESGGILHAVGVSQPWSSGFAVFEMKRDRTGWTKKCEGDFHDMLEDFPRMQWVGRDCTTWLYSVVTVIKDEEEEGELCVVLKMKEGIVQYNAKAKKFKKLRGLPRCSGFSMNTWGYGIIRSHKCVETLAGV